MNLSNSSLQYLRRASVVLVVADNGKENILSPPKGFVRRSLLYVRYLTECTLSQFLLTSGGQCTRPTNLTAVIGFWNDTTETKLSIREFSSRFFLPTRCAARVGK